MPTEPLPPGPLTPGPLTPEPLTPEPLTSEPLTSEPLTPVPDNKDWTWVLDRACPECGFRAGIAHAEIPDLIRADVQRWLAVLDRPEARERPTPTTWSPLEYGCHLRDVYRIFDGRLDQLLTEDDPLFANWDQDATALELRYWEADPAVAAVELETAGEALAARFAIVDDSEWQRPGRRSNGSVFTVETLAWYCLHDDLHHLWDVRG